MYRQGSKWLIHRACLSSAPLRQDHRSLILDALEALSTVAADFSYDYLEYDVESGTCAFASTAIGSRQALQCAREGEPTLIDVCVPSAQRVPELFPQWMRSDAQGPVPAVCSATCRGCDISTVAASGFSMHRSCIKRRKLSRPMKCVLRDGLLNSATTLLDYGCGSGTDVALLRGMGIPANGWDPISYPFPRPSVADIVNLGYVLNVISDPDERRRVLYDAYKHCTKLLVVAAQIANGVATKYARTIPFADGLLTSRGTFQKLYKQSELRTFTNQTLAVISTCREIGVFYVWRTVPNGNGSLRS